MQRGPEFEHNLLVVELALEVVEVVVHWVRGTGVEVWEAVDMARLYYFKACDKVGL